MCWFDSREVGDEPHPRVTLVNERTLLASLDAYRTRTQSLSR